MTSPTAPTGFIFAVWTALLLMPSASAAFELSSLVRPPAFTPINPNEPYDGFQIKLTSKFIFRPSLFQTEGAVLGLCVIFMLIHFVGKLRNRQIAEAWSRKAIPVLKEEFAAVVGDENGKGMLMWNGGSDAVIFASGRRGCQSLHTVFSLKPRHEPLQRIYNTVSDIVLANTVPSSRDQIVLTFTLPQTADNVIGVFGLVDKSVLQVTRSGRFDLTFTKVVDGDQAVTSRDLSAKWAIMSESPDLTDQFLGEPESRGQNQRTKIGIPDVLATPAGDLLQSLILTDQPAERPTAGPIAVDKRSRKLIITFNIPRSAAETEASLGLIRLGANIVDAIEKGSIRPRQETFAKLRKTRADVDKELHEEATKEQREAEEEARQEAKRKAEKEKLDKLSPAEQAKRKEIEKKRQLKKSGMKMKMR